MLDLHLGIIHNCSIVVFETWKNKQKYETIDFLVQIQRFRNIWQILHAGRTAFMHTKEGYSRDIILRNWRTTKYIPYPISFLKSFPAPIIISQLRK